MAMVYNFRYSMILVIILTAVLSGCVGQSPPATHYLLKAIEKPLENDQQTAVETTPLRIQVAPILLPKYLDRPQMVFFNDDHHVDIDPFNRWAEPLSDNFTRVIVENLGLLLNTDYVDRYTFKKKNGVDYKISIDVKRFDASPGREVVFIASWVIYSGKDQSQLLDRRYVVRKPVNAHSTSEIVAALNETINDFCREVAETIKHQGGGV